jgi:hypothetical protein
MGELQQAVRFITGHDIYNEGEVATFDRDEGERLIQIGAAVPYTAPRGPTTEQEFIPAKEVERQAKAAAKGQMDPKDPRSAEAKAKREQAAAELGGEAGSGGPDEYHELREAAFGSEYAKGAAEHGLVDPSKEVLLRRPATAPQTHPMPGAAPQSPEAKKVEEARAKAAKQGGKRGGKKGAKGGKPGASSRAGQAAGQGTGTGRQTNVKAQNQARDTRTEMRNRAGGTGAGELGPSSPKESGRAG